MNTNVAARRIGFFYLALVPFAVAAIGFGLGHSPYSIYIPVWMIHCCLMLASIGVLGFPALIGRNREKQQLLIVALFLVIPWMFIAIFAGMGPPPHVAAEWVATTIEQQTRYIILTAAGISFTLGLALLKEKLRQRGELFYSQLGFTAILIAIPFYIINMTYLGSYLAAALPHFVAVPVTERPDWYLAFRAQFAPESAVQVALTYVATAAFAASFKNSGWFGARASNTYLVFSLVGFVLSLLPDSLPAALAVPGYIVSVPAITFIMPYLMGLQLLKEAGGEPRVQ